MTTSDPDPVVEDWDRFCRLTSMTNHWDRPGWSPKRQSFHWFVTFRGADNLHALAASCQRRLRLPFLDHVPADALHVTVSRLAFTDEIAAAQVNAAIETAAAACSTTKPFALRVGPLAGSGGALRFTVTPWDSLTALRTAISEAAPHLGTTPPRGFRPHIGIAYCNDMIPVTAVIERVAALRTLPSVDVDVHALELVRLWRDGRRYRWETEARLAFGAPSPAGATTEFGDGAPFGPASRIR
jgi:2'-5' RNA ligase